LFANGLASGYFLVEFLYMESFKGNILILLFIAAVIGVGYWAIVSLNATNRTIAQEYEIEDVGPMVQSDALNYTPTPIPEEEIEVPAPTPAPETEKPTGLAGELQKLVDDNVLMKKGSRGTRVGTVQKFLVEYGIKLSIDNDYGDSVVAAVKKFQSEQKLSADGQAGPGTYKKMIEWLANN